MDTKEPFVITLSREVGSGGHTVGAILSEKLGVRYCDRQLLESLKKKFNLSATEIERLKAEKKNWLSDVLNMIVPMPPGRAIDINPRYVQEYSSVVSSGSIFSAEVEILKGFAQMGSCVIAGRSGFHVFKDHPNSLSIFITASLPFRIQRIMDKQGITGEEASSLIRSIDEGRENYIKRFTGVSRYDARNYDLVLRADGHTEEELSALILSYIGV